MTNSVDKGKTTGENEPDIAKLIFDTNIFIYHFNNQLGELGTDLLKQGLLNSGAYSVISKIEVLGFKQSKADDTKARQFLSQLVELPLTAKVTERTISIRQNLKIKTPDAIIAATAIEHSHRLVTRNSSDSSKIEDLDWLNPFIEQDHS